MYRSTMTYEWPLDDRIFLACQVDLCESSIASRGRLKPSRAKPFDPSWIDAHCYERYPLQTKTTVYSSSSSGSGK